jgi:hypothetical protein
MCRRKRRRRDLCVSSLAAWPSSRDILFLVFLVLFCSRVLFICVLL